MPIRIISLEGRAVRFEHHARPLPLGLLSKMAESLVGSPLPEQPEPEDVHVVLEMVGLARKNDHVIIIA